MRRTKIICTIGPASEQYDKMKELVLAGMNIIRLNFSHGDFEEHGARMENIKKIRKELNLPIAILLDTKGPEIRTKTLGTENGKVELKEGQDFTLTIEDIVGDTTKVAVTYEDITKDVEKGTRILIDDGLIELVVKEVTATDVVCTVKNGGLLGNKKGINIPEKDISLPAITEKDIADIEFGITQGIDFIAASFVRKAADVLAIKKILEENGAPEVKIISKIECRAAVKNIDEIINVSDGIMVARGDLGVEVPTEDVPVIQKMIIKKCNAVGKPVVTATQMLDSMIRNPRPTRAEATDVANAIYDGTDAIMLSGETANGSYPKEAVTTMAKIAERTESSIDYKAKLKDRVINETVSITNAISHATCTTAHDLGAAAILTVTKSGHTARMVSKYRPACPIVATTMDEKVMRQLNIVSNVYPFLLAEGDSTDEVFEAARQQALDSGFVKEGDLVAITAGVPVGISGTTNILKVEIVGNVLLRGTSVGKKNVSGNVYVVKDLATAEKEFTEGSIIVIESTANKAVLPLLRRASAIITEEAGITSPAAVVGQTLDIPVIVGAAGATRVLKTGAVVTLDMNRGLVYSGVTNVL